jgi:hypothetical protein
MLENLKPNFDDEWSEEDIDIATLVDEAYPYNLEVERLFEAEARDQVTEGEGSNNG